MRCRYCFYHDESERRTLKSYGFMSLETAGTLIERVFEYGNETVTFAFQGGEPTLRGFDFYCEFVNSVNEKNKRGRTVNYALQTNGLAVDAQFAQFFSENNFLVGLSLDGPVNYNDLARIDQNGNSTFNRILNAAKLFDDYKVSYNVLCVVNAYNAKKPQRLYNFFIENGFKYLQFIPCLPPLSGESSSFTLTPDKYDLFLKGLFDKWYSDIQAGVSVSVRMFDNILNMLRGYPPENCAMKGKCSVNLVIEADGSVFPCDFYAMDEWFLGNIADLSIEQLLTHSKAQTFSQRTAQTAQCRKCAYINLCRGGCPRDSHSVHGGDPYFCKSMREFFDYSLDRFKLIVSNK